MIWMPGLSSGHMATVWKINYHKTKQGGSFSAPPQSGVLTQLLGLELPTQAILLLLLLLLF